MATSEAPAPERYDPPSGGRVLTDAICVAVLGAGLWLAASAIARVSAAPTLVDCQTPVPQQAAALPVPGAAALAECGDKTAQPAAHPAAEQPHAPAGEAPKPTPPPR